MARHNSASASVRWEVIGTESTFGETNLLQAPWTVFLCAIVGHRVYVLPDLRKPSKIFMLDLNLRKWYMLHPGGDVPRHVSGGSLLTCDDRLVIIDGRVLQLKTVKVLDTVLMEWSKVEVSGDLFFPVAYHVAAFWEAKRHVLINSRDDRHDEQNPTIQLSNPTFRLDVDTMEMRRLHTKGPPPSRRYYHSSIWVETQEKWVIVCGQGPQRLLGDVCILDFRSAVPTWTLVLPFTASRGMSVCSPVLSGSKVLLFGGVRRGLDRTVVCSYNLSSGDMEEGVQQRGDSPPREQMTFQRILKRNTNDCVFIASRKRADLQRVYGLTIDH